ncbi:phasin protein [Cereibacter ovatus]|uniref:Phasin protein n=1 Tax=Cereibacter ovatus TaxID=439529 RepID=A0A285D231_9RHOB|nr:phasin family protein [Cereibacter ovatus]SNX73842.1 phasin protein [Cereibacter ovatus]
MTFPKRPQVADAPPTSPGDAWKTDFAFATGPTAVMEFWTRIANEAVQFSADRMCETVKTQQQMMHCRNLSEMAHLRAVWWQTAVDQYTAEVARLTEIWQETIDRTTQIRTH